MGDTTSRVFALLGLVIGVWIVAYWLYEPAVRRSLVVDDRPAQTDPQLPSPALPPPRSLPPAPRPDPSPAPEPEKMPPPEPAPVPGPGEMLIPPEFDDYTVQPADRSLRDIARKLYGDPARWTAIARANPFFTPDKLKPGVTVLRIPRDPDNIQGKVVKAPQPPAPSPAPPPAAAATPPEPPTEGAATAAGWRTYTVQADDTLWGIAKKMYGRPSLTALIAEANTDVLPDPDRLKPGITLKIPPAPPAD